MATKRIHWMGQSNSVFSLIPNYRVAVLRDTLNALLDGVHTVTIMGTPIGVSTTALPGGTPGTAAGGIAITRNVSANTWLVNDGIVANSSAWIQTEYGNLARKYIVSTLTTTQRAETDLIIYYWWEYDSVNDGDGASSSEVLDAGINEMVGTRMRSDYGKTPAELPILLVGPTLYSPSTYSGQELVLNAFNLLEARTSGNYTRFPGLTRDIYFGRDTSPDGGLTGTDYTSHATDADLDVHMKRLARFIARKWGPSWGVPAKYAGTGPQVKWVQYVDTSTLDVWVRHDGGTTLELGANAQTANGLSMWNVYVNGRRQVPVSVTIPSTGDGAGSRIRLTMASTMPSANVVRVAYGSYMRNELGGGSFQHCRGGLDGAIYDNADEVQSSITLVLPVALSGTNRAPGALMEQNTYLKARVSAPVF